MGGAVLVPFLFTFSLFVFSTLDEIPFAASRSLVSDSLSVTTEFDVTGSIQKTLGVLSFNSQTMTSLHRREPPNATAVVPSASASGPAVSSTLSLRLLPRSFLRKIPHPDYRSLLLSRLQRDGARVDFLNAKLDLAVNGVRPSDLRPRQEELQMDEIQSPVVSGMSHGSGEYFARIGFGTPAKQLYVVPDTGSDINWIQCLPCSDCYSQADPVFDPKGSSSYKTLGCSTAQCSALESSTCRNNYCEYQVAYGDGSYTVGNYASETMSFGSSGSVPNIAIGCGHDNEGLFVGSAGLLGLGRRSLSFNSQIKAKSFSYCFVDRDSSSSSTMDFNSAHPADSATAPLLRNAKMETFYYVGLSGISVGGELLQIPQSTFQVSGNGGGGIIVDSGTAVTRLQSEAYSSLRDAFVKRTQGLTRAGRVAIFDTCYDLSSKTTVTVPTVSFRFVSGNVLQLPAKNYLIPVDSAGTFCFAFAPTTSSLSIIGNIQQQGTRVTYDLANSLVSFSSNKC
ncbi:protein ASPARTIC PROTEASE IN GUARD CELL 1-like [Malania oleifera]|uniref:protein ASPARTIC PROTEASE IN GUARD CELL 1-like n=1 Tax=Malania oleifera TaxID=397392 RepID=UPI0025ADCC35|nr:protein ASPARTIC PROTEASE IN GUARD CELL 1-like [Malania oleifera]